LREAVHIDGYSLAPNHDRMLAIADIGRLGSEIMTVYVASAWRQAMSLISRIRWNRREAEKSPDDFLIW